MATASELLHDWLHGTANGGPNGDGRYPLIGADGETYLIKCPAAQALDPSMDPSELEVFANTAVQAANEASAAAESASTSASNAASSASAADTSRSQALSYRNTASTHATTATNKASEAASSASAAAGSASTASTANTNAQSAKTAAESARNKAQDWADKAEDSPVESGKFSAKHWAAKAAASAAALANLAWSAISGKPSINAGNGLTGGGLLDTSKTITLGTPGTLSGSTSNSVSTSSHTHALSANLSAWDGKHPDNYLEIEGGYGNATSNLDTISSTGIFRTESGATGSPGNYQAVLSLVRASTRRAQLAINTTGSEPTFNVRMYGGSWSPWRTVWHDGNLNPSDYAPTTTSIAAGNGLSGGGSLAANRTISLGTPGTLSGTTTNSVSSSSHTHALSANLSAWDGYSPTNAWVDKGTIPGSQNLNNYTTTGVYHQNANADATSGTNYPTNLAGMLVVYSSGNMTYQTYQVYNSGDVWTRSRYNTSWSAWKLSVDGTTSISAGNGLSGGGNLTSNRTISLGTPGTITATSTNSVSSTSHTHNLDTTGNFTWTGNHIFIGDMIARSGSASQQLTIERTGNNINAAAAYTTTGGTLYAGQGDTGYFAWGTNTDLRWSNASTWGRIGSGGLELKGTISASNITAYNEGNTIVQRNGSGDVFARLFRSEYASNAGAGSINYIMVQYATGVGADNYIRPATPYTIKSVLGISNTPNIFVQSGDPGSSANTGDLWVW